MGLRTILFLLTFLSSLASAQVQTISGTSLNINQPVTEAWGVFVGVYKNSTSPIPYDNCGFLLTDDPALGTIGTAGEFHGCHPDRVNGDTLITVQFSYSGVDGSNGLLPLAVLVQSSATGSSTNTEIGRNNNTVSIGDGTASVTFSWEDLCLLLVDSSGASATFEDADQTCSLSGQIQVSFGIGNAPNNIDNSTSVTFTLYNPIPTDGTVSVTQCDEAAPTAKFGFCDLAVKPGDSGGFLEPTEGFPNTNRVINQSFTIADAAGTATDISPSIPIDIEAVRIFAATTYVDAQPSVTSVKAFGVEVSSFNGNVASFDDTSFGRLTNDITYFLRAATVDSSGTISQMFDSSFSGLYQVTPSEVAGIIRENSCFITTATYGSDQAHQVNLFRKFREMFLYGNSFGRKVILLYNTYGPVGAEWVRNNPSSRSFMKALLYPFYGFAYLSVHYGLFTSLSFFAFLVFITFYLFRLRKEGDE